ncbi:hypothetical protein SAMN05216559_2989 [Halomicrobium zhouii]|uniref:Uncharacterized protein n=1 Tax=Halomicrobium zhouii TaxID=767519 RepID=A0A1I6LRR5_9EURY|nr:hypothetical protein [Halomicrobium zhouii]SFS06185.1 hypothetical protein SAMN05216559_2989 [Halomicrobium zhouii]
MVPKSLRKLPVVQDSPAARTYGSLFVLLFASLLLEFLFVWGVDTVSMLVPDVFDPQVAGAVVYALLGMVALATAYGLIRARRPAGVTAERYVVVQVGGVATMLLLVASYLLHGVLDLPVFPGDVLTSLLTGGVAMGLLGFAYARAGEFEVRLGFPERESLPLAGVTVTLGATAGVAQFAASTAPGHPLLTDRIVGAFAPQLSAGMLAWRVVVPGVCIGVGMGLLYNGAVQERLRQRLDPVCATAAVPALVGVLGWAFVAVGLTNSAVAIVGGFATVVLLSLLWAAIGAWGVRPVARRLDVEATPVVGASIGVTVVAIPLAGLAAIHGPAPGVAAAGFALTIVAAVACVAYERSRTVWIPALAFVSFYVVGDNHLLLSLVQFLP